MVFNSMSIVSIVFVGMIIWMGVLTVLVIRAVSHYNRLSKGITKAGLREVLETILRILGSVRKKSESLDQKVAKLEGEGALHIQRIGIVRFNPFADTGGAQSFSIALLNSANCGIVMTSLYGRNSNRWYVKEVRGGVGSDIALSKEEQEAIRNAVSVRSETA